jgi:spermidine synthase
MPHGPRPAYKHYDQVLEAAALNPDAKNVLIIGFGTGSITEVALAMESVERVTLVELSGSLIRNLSKFPFLESVLAHPKLEVIIDDGRRFLRRTDERFDLILMDPLRTTTAYSNNLYSMQFFELVRAHLAPGGVLMSMHGSRLGVVARTIASSFPYVRVHRAYSFGSETRLSRDEAQRQKLLEGFDVTSRAHIDDQHLEYLGDRDWVLEATRGLPVNQDWRPHAEYYLGL